MTLLQKMIAIAILALAGYMAFSIRDSSSNSKITIKKIVIPIVSMLILMGIYYVI